MALGVVRGFLTAADNYNMNRMAARVRASTRAWRTCLALDTSDRPSLGEKRVSAEVVAQALVQTASSLSD